MNESVYLFETVGEIADRYVLEAGERLRLFAARRRAGRRRLLRTLLIAAVITALMGVTAYAMSALGLAERIFPVKGTEKVVVVPNGLKGTKTYDGTGEWWTWVEEHRNDPKDYSLSFLQGDDRMRKTCELYWAYTPEAADKLFEIAERYGLTLYSESVDALNQDRLFALTGMEPFMPEDEITLDGGYVFPDGSFSTEGTLELSKLSILCLLQRFSTDALYPFGGVTRLSDYSERDYENARGQMINIISFSGGRMELWYLSSDGRTFVALRLYDLPDAERLAQAGFGNLDALAEALADQIDFAAVCRKNDAVAEIVSKPRGAADNRDAAERLEAFCNSPMFSAAREFHEFFTATFYGRSFTGVYGQEGYEDIDAELSRLAEKYGLRYATSKTDTGQVTRYDNGAAVWDLYEQGSEEMDIRALKIYALPKDALYTGLIHFAAPEEYRRSWFYETEEGQQILCFCDGPEKVSGVYLLYETESRYVLALLGWHDVAVIEETAESIDWTRYC